LNIDVFVKQTLRGVDVHIDRDGALVDREWIHGCAFGGNCVLIIVIHLFITTAGRKR
jgi:hypothetical protein